jgi:hypothetical protein
MRNKWGNSTLKSVGVHSRTADVECSSETFALFSFILLVAARDRVGLWVHNCSFKAMTGKTLTSYCIERSKMFCYFFRVTCKQPSADNLPAERSKSNQIFFCLTKYFDCGKWHFLEKKQFWPGLVTLLL